MIPAACVRRWPHSWAGPDPRRGSILFSLTNSSIALNSALEPIIVPCMRVWLKNSLGISRPVEGTPSVAPKNTNRPAGLRVLKRLLMSSPPALSMIALKPPACFFQDFVIVLLSIADAAGGAYGFRLVDFFLRTTGHINFCAQRAGPLDSKSGNTAAGPRHQHGLSRFHLGLRHNSPPGRQTGERNRG